MVINNSEISLIIMLLLTGRARAQFIPQKKHCTSQAPAEQVGPDDVHGLPTPASPDSASHASTSSQKSGSNKSERFSVLEKTKVIIVILKHS